ncbi:MAG: YcaQ family DNA glycosylase [Sphingomonas sp.]|nr:YcaQ family DNA glycosylase [Sphingomonas sp.]
MTPEPLSTAAARRIALAAQGFGAPRPASVDRGHLRRTLDRIALHQIDSVNVLARAHYLPAFSRLGPYDRALLDNAAWGPRRQRRLFEYWAHEASLLPLELHPLLRWRMAEAERGAAGWNGLRAFASERRAEAEAILARIRDEGPMAASDFEHGRSRSGWWEWGATKQALEWLFWSGRIATATRRGNFERVYDLAERAIPAAIRDLPAAEPAEAQRRLTDIAARALGVATAGDLRDYFRLGLEESRAAVAALVEEGALLPVAVEGWRQPAYLHAEARRPRRIAGQALLAPFDPLIWERGRAERLFGFRYRIEIYTPAHKRTHGYYVLPFLMDDALVARVDLKSDRQAGRLLVQNAHLEPGAPPETTERLATELTTMAGWLGLEPPIPEGKWWSRGGSNP